MSTDGNEREVGAEPGGAVCGTVTATVAADGSLQAEAALREANRWALLLGQHGHCFAVGYRVGLTPLLEHISASCEAVTGYTPEEFAANPNLFFWRMHPDDRPATPAAAGAQVSDSRQPPIVRWLRKDGRVIWLERREAGVRGGQTDDGVVEAVICDVTDRMQVQEAANEDRLWQSALLRALPVVVARVTWQGGPRLVWISDSVEAATGFPVARFLGESEFWLDRVHPTDRAGLLGCLEGSTPGSGEAARFSWRCSDESYHWFSARELHIRLGAQPPGERVIALSPVGALPAGASEAETGAEPAGGAQAGRTSSHWRRLIISPPPVESTVTSRPERCLRCGSESVIRHSRQVRRLDGGRTQAEVVRFRCRSCDATFTWYPEGVGRGLQGDAVKALCRLLYGLGLSKHQVSDMLGQAGVTVSEGTVWRNASGLGGDMRRTAPAGARCLLPDQPTPPASDFVVVDRLAVAGPDASETVLELRLWEHSGHMLPWLRSHLEAMGLACEVVVL